MKQYEVSTNDLVVRKKHIKSRMRIGNYSSLEPFSMVANKLHNSMALKVNTIQENRRPSRWQRSKTWRHLSPHKYVKNTSTYGKTPTEHLLNAGRRPETSQKARKSPRTGVGQKKKQRQKNRDGTCTSGREL